MRGDDGQAQNVFVVRGRGDSFDGFKGLFLPKRQANGGKRKAGWDWPWPDPTMTISVHKKDMMKVFLPVALSAAAASVGYLAIARLIVPGSRLCTSSSSTTCGRASRSRCSVVHEFCADDGVLDVFDGVQLYQTDFGEHALVGLSVHSAHHMRDVDDQGDARVESGESRMVVDSARNRSHQG